MLSLDLYLDCVNEVLFTLVRSLGCVNEVRFADGITLSPDLANNIGWGKDLVTSTLEFACKLNDIEIDAVEFAILNGIMLTYPGMKTKIKIASMKIQN